MLRGVLLVFGIGALACGPDRSAEILDGACREGCIVLADQVCDPYGIAVRGETVYWTSKLCGTVTAVPRAGGAQRYVSGGTYFGSNDKAAGIAVDADHAYVTSPAGDSIYVYSVAGGPAVAWDLEKNEQPREIAVDDQFVYWTSAWGSVRRSRHTGEDTIAIATAQAHPMGIAVSGGFVYWANNGTGGVYWATNRDGAIMRAPITGGAPTAIAVNEAGPAQLAVDANDVYWTNPLDGTVRKAPVAGGPAVTIAAGQSAPMGIGVDAGHVYWTIGIDESGNGGVMSASLATGALAKLASDQNGPFRLVVDGAKVYWTDPGGAPLQGGRVVSIRAL